MERDRRFSEEYPEIIQNWRAAELVGSATVIATVAVYNYLSSREASED